MREVVRNSYRSTSSFRLQDFMGFIFGGSTTPNERIEIEIMGLKEVGRSKFSKSFENPHGGSNIYARDFEHRLEWCHLMEEKIKEKGWDTGYWVALSEIVSGSKFDLIHASAAQRTEAAIRMLDEMRGKG